MKHISKPIIFFAIAVMLLFPMSLLADQDRRDGNWWRGESYSFKLNYIVGFFDGMSLGHNFSYWKTIDKKEEKDIYATKISRQSYQEYMAKYFSVITNDQITDGLNIFYEDYRNRNILVKNAVWLIAQQVAGTPKTEMEQMIEDWRKSSTYN